LFAAHALGGLVDDGFDLFFISLHDVSPDTHQSLCAGGRARGAV
jgi:hypothetical protein